jgi:hypothetical protein
MAVALFTSVQSDHWDVDSGSNVGLTFERSDLTDFREVPAIPITAVGQGKTAIVEAYGIGTVHFTDVHGNTEEYHDVLFAPKDSLRLFSITSAVRQRFTPEFHNNGTSISISKGVFSIQADSNTTNDLYSMARGTTATAFLANVSMEQWHIRLGHASSTTMRPLGLIATHDNFNSSKCEVCILSKMPSSPHNSTTPFKYPLERVVSDTWGPHTFEDGINSYYVTFICVKTGYLWAYPVTTKSSMEVRNAFIDFRSHAEKESGYEVKIVFTDEGKEYLKDMFAEIKSAGIKHDTTAAYSQSSNGITDRANRTIMNTMRSILKQSNMPPSMHVLEGSPRRDSIHQKSPAFQ